MELTASRTRIESIDILRGIIIVIMGLDHVRDFVAPTLFAPEDVTQTSPAWFFTRWVTHFCAPGFVFLAGISAFLYSTKVTGATLRKFLITRGVWLIVMEFTVVHFGWMFDHSFWFVQVIWVIGWSMIILALFTYVPRTVMIVFTVVVLLGHNLLDTVHIDSLWWYFLHEPNWNIPIGSTSLAIVYPLIPWPAVMTLGFLVGELMLKNEHERHRLFKIIGTTTIAAFIIIRLINMYGDPHLWLPSSRGGVYTVLDFLNTTKYPPSLLFLTMTLGPVLLILPRLERWKGKVGQIFLVFGRVPFFYYIVHFYVGHLLAILYHGIRYERWEIFLFDDPKTWPQNYVPNLVLVYLFWILLTTIMYFLCRWFVQVKKQRDDWWLKYL